MIVGFTGTQEGMTERQFKVFTYLMSTGRKLGMITEGHHGDCVGADEEADRIMKEAGIKRVAHPPINESKRAFCDAEVILPAKEYLARNRDIVDLSSALVATPRTKGEQLRSGTWSTIRYAKKIGRPVLIIFPDGTTQAFNS